MHIAEIQVRTIFEEGWSEIDHKIRYPYDADNPVLGQFLVVFNRLAGSADEMGSFVKLLKRKLDSMIAETEASIEQSKNEVSEKNRLIDDLTKTNSIS